MVFGAQKNMESCCGSHADAIKALNDIFSIKTQTSLAL